MAEALRHQEEESGMDSVPFDERFALLVEAEWLQRKNHRIGRLVSQAAFRFPATLEDFQNSEGCRQLNLSRYIFFRWGR
jgi:hypothetical protein